MMVVIWFLSGVIVGSVVTCVYMARIIIPHAVKKFEKEGYIRFLKEPKK